ncbi:hypothetical protein [Streptomyces sp. NPDC052107]|uniref:hypothetical protein n=1 Tax=Streptomyces sp. NPDC052107 TaxID=3155632 RepID=UPI0034273F89
MVRDVGAEVLVEVDAGTGDERVDDRVEVAVVGVDRLARQVGDRVDAALGRPVGGLLFQLADAESQVAGDEVDDLAPAAVVRACGDDSCAVEGAGVGDLELGSP